jgi:TetR/AcrR family transcriptional regulator, regulator of cefoperazone and chloramphenicol sensitivity
MAGKDPVKTKERLLDAATTVFVEMGYRDATVAEICRRGGANISAVNYYFGSKKALYREAWLHAFNEAMKAHPPDGGVGASASAEERLRGRVTAIMARIADEKCRDFAISQMELASPTGLLEDLMRSELPPLREKTRAVVRELLGPGVSEVQVQFCEVCIVSMCVDLMLMRKNRRGEGKDGTFVHPTPMDDLEAFADHVVKFSLAGMAAIRDQA